MAAWVFDSKVTDRPRDYSRLESTIYNRAHLSTLKVMVVGAGALGNEIIKNLTLLGLGNLYIVDRDVIEPSNLTRSVLFCVPHVDQILANRTWKAEFAASRVRELNPEVQAVPIVGEIADVGLGLLARMDLVFSCVDNEWARLELGWSCQRLNIPFVDGGLATTNYSSGLISIYPGAEGPCYACRKGPQKRRELLQELQGLEDPCWMKERQLEEQGSISTTPLMASVVAAMQVELGLRHLLHPGSPQEGRSVHVALAPEPVMESFSFAVSHGCPMHESNIEQITRLPARRSDDITVTELILATGLGETSEAMLCLDWPLVVEAECRSCGLAWQPMMRKARFRRHASCPSCGKNSHLVEREVLTSIDASSLWASRTLTQLGLPKLHIHEVADGSSGFRRHVEVSGDWPNTN
jgi:adenylyltransferase/sulfurtransferase